MDALEQSRLRCLTDQIDFYLWKHYETGKLSSEQKQHLKTLCDEVMCFGELGHAWANEGLKLLN